MKITINKTRNPYTPLNRKCIWRRGVATIQCRGDERGQWQKDRCRPGEARRRAAVRPSPSLRATGARRARTTTTDWRAESTQTCAPASSCGRCGVCCTRALTPGSAFAPAPRGSRPPPYSFAPTTLLDPVHSLPLFYQPINVVKKTNPKTKKTKNNFISLSPIYRQSTYKTINMKQSNQQKQ